MPRPSRELELEWLESAASRLRPIERDVLFLSAREGLSNDEIAVRLGIPTDEARAHLADALYHLDCDLERRARPWWKFW